MISRIAAPAGPGDCYATCIRAGDFVFTSHHGGAYGGQNNTADQLRCCFEGLSQSLDAVGASIEHVVQLNLLLKDRNDFASADAVFTAFFTNGFPCRTTYVTDFVSDMVLVQIDAVAYCPQTKVDPLA